MSVLVTGGAGYIGAAFVERLSGAGERAVVLDDLSRGHRDAVPPGVPLYQGRCGDSDLVARIVREEAVEACVHFAAFAYVGESVGEPKRYFDNNTAQALGLFETLLGLGVGRVVFSSTCATYGVPRRGADPGDAPPGPINPYGWSKFFVERMLEAFDHAHGLRFVGLRYFNAAGATGLPRRAARPGDPPHPARAPGGGRPAPARVRLRHGLSHAGRDGRPRLHPRRGPRRCAPGARCGTSATAARPSS